MKESYTGGVSAGAARAAAGGEGEAGAGGGGVTSFPRRRESISPNGVLCYRLAMRADIQFGVEGLEQQQREALGTVNEVLSRLVSRRRAQIRVEGLFAQSKLAWKLAILQEAFLHRAIGLAHGVALAWNAGNSLTAILAARALIETIVLVEDLYGKMDAFLKAENLTGINQLTDTQTFATRDAEWLAQHPESQATNILTLIDKFDKRTFPGARAHYDSLSERCHPNSRGHFGMFASLDCSNGTVTFSDAKSTSADRIAIMPAVMLLGLFERTIGLLDLAVSAAGELQHRVNSV